MLPTRSPLCIVTAVYVIFGAGGVGQDLAKRLAAGNSKVFLADKDVSDVKVEGADIKEIDALNSKQVSSPLNCRLKSSHAASSGCQCRTSFHVVGGGLLTVCGRRPRQAYRCHKPDWKHGYQASSYHLRRRGAASFFTLFLSDAYMALAQ